jgi:predicted acetyltransferase
MAAHFPINHLMDIRALSSAEELRAAFAPLEQVFAFELTNDVLEREQQFQPPERFLVAAVDGQIVGSAAALPFGLTVPGGTVPASGITSVAVLPTYRRRGVMSTLLERQLAECQERGEPVAILWASEGSIYGRFGFGLATFSVDIDADRSHLRLADAGVEVESRLVANDEALRAIPPIYERARARTVGMLDRPRRWWEAKALVAPEYSARRDAPPLRWVVLAVDGKDQAYAGYRLHTSWEDGLPAGRLQVLEAIGATPEAVIELWRWLAGIDLVERIEARRLPIDHPLVLRIPEPARLRMRVGDGVWLRVVDVPAALAARTLLGDVSVVVDLADERCPWNAGRWRIDAGGAARTRRVAELRLGASELGAAYLGGFTFRQLGDAGRVEELRRGAIERADTLFRADRAPWCPEVF